MVQICVWFGRPLEKTRFIAKCKGKPWLGHVLDLSKRTRVVPVSWHHFSFLSAVSPPLHWGLKTGRGFENAGIPHWGGMDGDRTHEPRTLE